MSQTLRSSGATRPNAKIISVGERGTSGSNMALLARRPRAYRNAVLLIGGTSLAHFRIRFAQAIMRRDLLPSFWSQVGLLADNDTVLTVPVDNLGDVSRVPEANGVEIVPLSAFSDVRLFPNLAILRFADNMGAFIEKAKEVSPHRDQLSVPSLVVRWLSYIWAVDGDQNPLAGGIGTPSARWLENIFSSAGLELAPGLTSGASCPEAVWQAARWWHEFYAPPNENAASPLGRRQAICPEGIYIVRQAAAALLGPRDSIGGMPKSGSPKSSKEFTPVRR